MTTTCLILELKRLLEVDPVGEETGELDAVTCGVFVGAFVGAAVAVVVEAAVVGVAVARVVGAGARVAMGMEPEHAASNPSTIT